MGAAKSLITVGALSDYSEKASIIRFSCRIGRKMRTEPSYQLDPQKIIDTIAKLQERIGERFPESGLLQVCGRLLEIAEHMKERSAWIGRPNYKLRATAWAICATILILTVITIVYFAGSDAIDLSSESGKLASFVTLLEAGMNDVVLIGAAIFFFFTMERRYKRNRALKAIHELRSIAHVIDMHQLTKDPHRLINQKQYQFTGLSPRLEMTPFLLRRYLSYCIELLSLSGKVAAVYVQEFDDSVALASVSDLEQLGTGLCNKIWQKMSMLELDLEEPRPKIHT